MNVRRPRSLLLSTLLVVALPSVEAQGHQRLGPSPRPVAPVTVTGACPGECCKYGKWKLRTSATVRGSRASSAPLLARLAPGTPITSDRGIVVVSRLGLVVVRGQYRDEDMGARYAAGDSIILLDYLGENFFNAWFRGDERQVAANWGYSDTSAAQLVIEPQSSWWAHVRWRDGQRRRAGWVRMDSVGVDGAAACG